MEAPNNRTSADFLKILDYIPLGACVLSQNMEVVFWNCCLEDVSKINRNEIIGTKIHDYFPNLSAPKYTRRLEEIFNGGMPVLFSSQLHKYFFPFPSPNGGFRFQDVAVSALPMGNNEFYALICIQDVTALTMTVDKFKAVRDRALVEIEERKRTELELCQKTEELEQQNQYLIQLNQTNQLLLAENYRMGAELSVAERIQRMILPQAHELTLSSNLEIATYMEPAAEVGGDYYDVICEGEKVKIAIGDVTGHGLESGIMMMMAQTAIRCLMAMGETNPVEFLVAVNETIYNNVQRMGFDKFMTLLIVEYETNQIRISGQHEEVIVVRSNGSLEHFDTFDLGFPIGLEPDIRPYIAELAVTIGPDDLVLLFTDGLTEAENRTREFYGLSRICDVLVENRHLRATEVCRILVKDLKDFIGEQKVFDDITIVILKQK